MSEFRQLHRSFWESNTVEALDPVEKLLYVYAITGPKSNMEGMYRVTLRRVSFETGIDRDMVVQLFGRLEEARVAGWRDGWCCVTQAIKYMPKSPQMITHAKTLYASVPKEVMEWALSIGYMIPSPLGIHGVSHNTIQYNTYDTAEHTVSDEAKSFAEQAALRVSDAQAAGIGRKRGET